MGCSQCKAAMAKAPGPLKPKGLQQEVPVLSKHERQKILTQLQSKSEHKHPNRHMMENLVGESFCGDIQKFYSIIDAPIIGHGSFGTVQAVRSKECGEQYAMKTLDLSHVPKDQFDVIIQEVEIMKRLDHPNIVRLQEVFYGVNELHLVMDLYTGGKLLDRYQSKGETHAAAIIHTVLVAIRYCHERRIAHRDLKLENIMFEHEGDDAELKVVDFGLGGIFEGRAIEHDIVGSWTYMAPEVLSQRGHDPMMADMWAIGILTHELLVGKPVYEASSVDELRYKIEFEPLQFKDPRWHDLSTEAKDFVKALLNRDASNRMAAGAALQHPWIVSRHPRRDTAGPLSAEVVTNMREFTELNMATRVFMQILARIAPRQQFRGLEKEFLKADIDELGVLKPESFRTVALASGIQGPEEADRIFQSMDLQKQGYVSFTEFMAAAQGEHQVDDHQLRAMFDRLDHYKQGKLTPQGLKYTVGCDLTEAELEEAMKEFDGHNKAECNFKEFCEGVRMATRPVGRFVAQPHAQDPAAKPKLAPTDSAAIQELREAQAPG